MSKERESVKGDIVATFPQVRARGAELAGGAQRPAGGQLEGRPGLGRGAVGHEAADAGDAAQQVPAQPVQPRLRPHEAEVVLVECAGEQRGAGDQPRLGAHLGPRHRDRDQQQPPHHQHHFVISRNIFS